MDDNADKATLGGRLMAYETAITCLLACLPDAEFEECKMLLLSKEGYPAPPESPAHEFFLSAMIETLKGLVAEAEEARKLSRRASPPSC